MDKGSFFVKTPGSFSAPTNRSSSGTAAYKCDQCGAAFGDLGGEAARASGVAQALSVVSCPACGNTQSMAANPSASHPTRPLGP